MALRALRGVEKAPPRNVLSPLDIRHSIVSYIIQTLTVNCTVFCTVTNVSVNCLQSVCLRGCWRWSTVGREVFSSRAPSDLTSLSQITRSFQIIERDRVALCTRNAQQRRRPTKRSAYTYTSYIFAFTPLSVFCRSFVGEKNGSLERTVRLPEDALRDQQRSGLPFLLPRVLLVQAGLQARLLPALAAEVSDRMSALSAAFCYQPNRLPLIHLSNTFFFFENRRRSVRYFPAPTRHRTTRPTDTRSLVPLPRSSNPHLDLLSTPLSPLDIARAVTSW